MNSYYDVIIIGTGPGGLGAAFRLAENSNKKVLMLEKAGICSGGLKNDCKQNYCSNKVGFFKDHWTEDQANYYLDEVKRHLNPTFQVRTNMEKYVSRATKYGAELLEIDQYHVGTDKSSDLINGLISRLKERGVDVQMNTEMVEFDYANKSIKTNNGDVIEFGNIIFSVGRKGAYWIQNIMNSIGVSFVDNTIDIGVRVELKQENYPIVKDFYDPKFYLPNDVRTFCTNSGAAYIVQERYEKDDRHFYSVNGHALSKEKPQNGLVNFALLKTIKLTKPLASATDYGYMIGQNAMLVGGGKPIMQRVGDIRARKRSKKETFNEDLYDFEPSFKIGTPGDITLAMPAKIFEDIWSGLKTLDKIIPGVMHPSTILAFPEIKMYTSRPVFIDDYFKIKENVYACGDSVSTSRGITGAWASGARAADGILV